MTKALPSDPVHVIGMEICEQAGIDPNKVTGIDLSLRISELPTMTIHYIPDTLELGETLKRFKIEPIDG